jgi:type I site-specific restriction-modification system R (restriction) subunit
MQERGTESTFELTTLQRLDALQYQHAFGMEIERPHDEVVLRDVLRDFLSQRYRDLPPSAIEQAVRTFSKPEGVDTLHRNLAFHQMLTRGLELKVEFPDGRVEHRHVYAVNWDEPHKNDVRAINQFPIHGQNDRRPDIIIFVNGLPLVVLNQESLRRKATSNAQPGPLTRRNPHVNHFPAIAVISTASPPCTASDGGANGAARGNPSTASRSSRSTGSWRPHRDSSPDRLSPLRDHRL